jgi:hydroxypyruvate isomerase
MYELSATIELLFTEHGEGDAQVADRLRAAAALGLPAVEIWSWRGKDVAALSHALQETGIKLQTMCVDPMGVLVDPATHSTFLAAVTESAATAKFLDCPFLVVTAGDDQAGVSRSEQHSAIVAALREAARLLEGSDVVLLLENLNSRVDHVGTFLDSTVECLDIVEEVDSPSVRVLYDHYHSLVMDERPESVLAGRIDLVGHVQTADVPGRHEPGTGTVDWENQLRILHELGYRGRIGLECSASIDTASSLDHIQHLIGKLA